MNTTTSHVSNLVYHFEENRDKKTFDFLYSVAQMRGRIDNKLTRDHLKQTVLDILEQAQKDFRRNPSADNWQRQEMASHAYQHVTKNL